MRTRPPEVLAGALALCLLARTAIAIADAGVLDPSFGMGGIATGPAGDFSDAGLQSDGAIVAVGNDPSRSPLGGFGIVRLRSDGALDATFGEGGGVYSGCGSCYGSWGFVAVQPDDKIVVAGAQLIVNPQVSGLPLPRLARYLSDGTPDDSFPDWNPFGDSGSATSLTSSPRGDLLLSAAANSDGRLLVARLDRDGTLDPSFGDGGIADVGVDRALATDLTLQADGKVLALAGRRGGGLNPANAILIRLQRNGRLDPHFGSDGVVGFDLGPRASPRAIALQPDGNIVVGGTDDPAGIFLVRFDRSGRPDRSFGSSGVVRSNVAASLLDLQVEPDGKVVALGWHSFAGGSQWVVARFDRGGSPDSSFGQQGSTVTRISKTEPGEPLRLLPMQGKLLAVGFLRSGLAAARYLDPESSCRPPILGRSSGVATPSGSGESCGSGAAPLRHYRRVAALRAR